MGEDFDSIPSTPTAQKSPRAKRKNSSSIVPKRNLMSGCLHPCEPQFVREKDAALGRDGVHLLALPRTCSFYVSVRLTTQRIQTLVKCKRISALLHLTRSRKWRQRLGPVRTLQVRGGRASTWFCHGCRRPGDRGALLPPPSSP